jgi:hypothetical protein
VNLFELYSIQLFRAKICCQIQVTTTKSSHQVTGNWVQVKGERRYIYFCHKNNAGLCFYSEREGRLKNIFKNNFILSRAILVFKGEMLV